VKCVGSIEELVSHDHCGICRLKTIPELASLKCRLGVTSMLVLRRLCNIEYSVHVAFPAQTGKLDKREIVRKDTGAVH